ncbi:MAG: hypothetical protein ACRDOO_06725 [Actinomadura sp.]
MTLGDDDRFDDGAELTELALVWMGTVPLFDIRASAEALVRMGLFRRLSG